MNIRACLSALLLIVSPSAAVFAAFGELGDNRIPALAFSATGSNEFHFDTGVLRGKLRAKGAAAGLSSVIHVPTGVRLDASMGLMSHYRVFSAGKRYGTAAWDWPSRASQTPSGSVSVFWPASPERPFEMSVTYAWVTPVTLEVETRVLAKTNLARFESFLATYWSPSFSNSLVYVRDLPGRPGQSGLVAAEKGAGQWQVFPRDLSAVETMRDGRWRLEPNPVDWVVQPWLAKPLGVRRAPALGLAALLMSPPNHCFAISTPHQDEAHYSMYLSLFGVDLKPEETVRAKARLVIALNPSDAEIDNAYDRFTNTAVGR